MESLSTAGSARIPIAKLRGTLSTADSNMNEPIQNLGAAMAVTNMTPAGLDKTKRRNDDGTYTKSQYIPHCGKRQQQRNLQRMAKAELKMLKARHGTDVKLDGRTPEGIIVEPTRAQNFDNGIVDLQEHESR